MKKLVIVGSVGLVLSGCIVSPEQSTILNVDQPVAITGLVRNKTLPIVVRCEPDSEGDSPIYMKVLPSTTAILDKEGRSMYSFSALVNVPDQCKFRISVGQEGYQYRSVHFDIAQEVVNRTGGVSLRHQNIVPTNHALTQCAFDQWNASGSWADIITECAALAPAGDRGNLYVRSDIEAPAT